MTARRPWLVPFLDRCVSAEYAERIRSRGAKAPPLTQEQVDLLRVLLNPAQPAARRGRRSN